MILVADLDAASVLVMFGVMQIATALSYGMPMPAQPLKAMSVLVITQNLGADVLYGGGLAIGITMLALSAAGVIDLIARAVPKTVVRGIQLGLALQLLMLALGNYVPDQGPRGYLLAAVAFTLVLLLLGNRRLPPALLIIALGVAYALVFNINPETLVNGVGLAVPHLYRPDLDDIVTGFVLLALPQLPLSLGNSVLATRQIALDLFPQRAVSVRKIGFTYSLMNLVNPFFGGVPTCHGSGGIAGHYAFGARTGGSIVIYGALYVVVGLFFSGAFADVVELFPLPILGVVLVFEALALARLVGDQAHSRLNLAVAVLVGVVAATLPYGYVIGLVVGTIVVRFAEARARAPSGA